MPTLTTEQTYLKLAELYSNQSRIKYYYLKEQIPTLQLKLITTIKSKTIGTVAKLGEQPPHRARDLALA